MKRNILIFVLICILLTVALTAVGCNFSSSNKGSDTTNVNQNAQSDAVDLTDAVITFAKTSYAFTGFERKPSFNVYIGDTLVPKQNYTQTFENNVNVGTATLTVTGTGACCGGVSANFEIVKANIADAVFELENESIEYTGLAVCASIGSAKLYLNRTTAYTLSENTDYTLSFENNVERGTARVIVEGKGNFEGKTTLLYSITGISVAAAKISVESADRTYNGTAFTPSVTVECNGATLVENVDYTLTFEDNVNAGTAKVIVEGIGGYTSTKSATFEIGQLDISSAAATLASESVEFYGKNTLAKVQSVTLNTPQNGTLEIGALDYVVTGTNNADLGEATLVITGKRNCTGSIEKTFVITALDISDAEIVLENATYAATGHEIEPCVLAVYANGILLDKTDYIIAYSSNVDVSKTAPTVTLSAVEGGNYVGQASVNFEITDTVYTLNFVTDEDGENSPLFAPLTLAEGQSTSVPDEKNVSKNGTANLTGYSYIWYDDSSHTTLHTFGAMPASNLTVYGKLQEEQGYSFFVYDFENAASLTLGSDNDFAAFVDYIMYYYVSSTSEFYAAVGTVSFDENKSLVGVSDAYLASLLGSDASTLGEASAEQKLSAIKSAVDTASNGSTFSSNVVASFNFAFDNDTNSFSIYCTYAMSNEKYNEGSLSATKEVLGAGASNRNYANYTSLNVLQNGSAHTLAIDGAVASYACYTSNQLSFLLEHGVKPIATASSPAEKVYAAAKNVLNETVNENMSEYQKTAAIYSWLVSNVSYDYNVLAYDGTEDTSFTLSKGTKWMYYDAYYLEGVFGINNADGEGIAVCDGIAKAFVVLCQMEGIDAVRVTGSAKSSIFSAAGGHAWNKVKLNGKWYVVDATWGNSVVSNANFEENTGECADYAYFLFDESDTSLYGYRNCYSNGNFDANGNLNYFSQSTFVVDLNGNGQVDKGETLNFVMDDIDDLKALFLYCIYQQNADGSSKNIDGYTIQFEVSKTFALGEYQNISEALQAALTAAKAEALVSVGYEKNFESAIPMESQNYMITLLFEGEYKA